MSITLHVLCFIYNLFYMADFILISNLVLILQVKEQSLWTE